LPYRFSVPDNPFQLPLLHSPVPIPDGSVHLPLSYCKFRHWRHIYSVGWYPYECLFLFSEVVFSEQNFGFCPPEFPVFYRVSCYISNPLFRIYLWRQRIFLTFYYWNFCQTLWLHLW